MHGTNDPDELHIHQYSLQDEIGRGSFGAVYRALDDHGRQYAIKEYSKSRLRHRAQSQLLRQRRRSVTSTRGQPSPLEMLDREVAIMKSLDHANVLTLVEVIDADVFIYMVLEFCQKGVLMIIDVDVSVTPYSEAECRMWFRQLLSGIEYLHGEGVVHRDIKPENLLRTAENVLKIADYGLSEKNAEMRTAKGVGTPAFLPPELCQRGQGEGCGRAADVWSMGVTLYCLRYGRLPFAHRNVLELYRAIQEDAVVLQGDLLADLLHRMLEKDPRRRIGVEEMMVMRGL